MIQETNKPFLKKLLHLFFLFFLLTYLTQCEKEEALKDEEEKNMSA